MLSRETVKSTSVLCKGRKRTASLTVIELAIDGIGNTHNLHVVEVAYSKFCRRSAGGQVKIVKFASF